MDFQGVGFVTGAAAGMGRATALLMAKEGCQRLAITDVNEQGLNGTKVEIQKSYPSVEVLAKPVNLIDETAVIALIDEVVARFGRLDYCANVAGLVPVGPGLGNTHDFLTSDWELTNQVNLRGVFFLERAQIKAMLKQDLLSSIHSSFPARGSIVNVSSTSGLRAHPYLPAYSAAKHGVVGLSKSDGMAYGKDGIRVNVVCPGPTDTARIEDQPEGGRENAEKRLRERHRFVNEIAMGRMGEASEIAQAIIWLLSGRSSFVNAIEIVVSGGIYI